MECRDAQFYLRFRRPGRDELDTDVAAEVDQHLAGCPHCASESRWVASFDNAVSKAMRSVAVPAGLRERLITGISARRGAVLRRRAYRTAALAASLFLTVGLAFGIFTAARPAPDTTALVLNNDSVGDPDAAEQQVRNWLHAEGLPPDLPEPFDYRLHRSHHWEEVQGRKVPVVLFNENNGPGFAKVYIFRSTQFNVKDVQEAQGSFCQARPYPNEAEGIVYVIVFTGQDLTPFLRGGRFARDI
jgi:Protein of unknown function (DUF3379)